MITKNSEGECQPKRMVFALARLIRTCHLSLCLRIVATEILQVGPAELLDLAVVSKASGYLSQVDDLRWWATRDRTLDLSV
jgi:hypothetical protein